MKKRIVLLAILLLVSIVSHGQTSYFKIPFFKDWNHPLPQNLKKVTVSLVEDSLIERYDEYFYDKNGSLLQINRFNRVGHRTVLDTVSIYTFSYDRDRLTRKTSCDYSPYDGVRCQIEEFFYNQTHAGSSSGRDALPDRSVSYSRIDTSRFLNRYDKRGNLVNHSRYYSLDSNKPFSFDRYKYTKKGYIKNYKYYIYTSSKLKLYVKDKYEYTYYPTGQVKYKTRISKVNSYKRVKYEKNVPTYVIGYNPKGEIISFTYPQQSYHYTVQYEYY